MRQVRWNRHDYFVPLSEGVRRKSRDEESEAGGGTSPALCKNWEPRNVSWCVFCACCHCVEHRSIKFIYLKHEFLSPCAKRHGAEISLAQVQAMRRLLRHFQSCGCWVCQNQDDRRHFKRLLNARARYCIPYAATFCPSLCDPANFLGV